jgi:hypothetical protein
LLSGIPHHHHTIAINTCVGLLMCGNVRTGRGYSWKYMGRLMCREVRVRRVFGAPSQLRWAVYTNSPTEGAISPTEGAISPTEAVNSPTEEVNSPTKGVNSPTEGVSSPTEGVISPTEGVNSPNMFPNGSLMCALHIHGGWAEAHPCGATC